MNRRRRALLLGGLAFLLGGLAASNVASREAALERRVGGLVDVVVVRKAVAAGSELSAGALAVRKVPRRFAPEGAIAQPEAVAGLLASVDIAAGTDLTTALVGDGAGEAAAGGRTGPPIRAGERVAEIVALGSPELITPGSRVDVLVTPEPRASENGRAVLALEDVEVIGAGAAEHADEPASKSAGKPSPGKRVAVSLRVTLRQAVYLAAAQDFARELRLLPRATSDRRRGQAGLVVGAGLP